MVIPPFAAWALEQLGIVRIEVQDHPGIQDGPSAPLAGHPKGATGHGGEDVVSVHGT